MKKIIFLLLSVRTLAQTVILPSGNDTFITSSGIVVDNKNQSNGTLFKGIRFGSFSGEGIASYRQSTDASLLYGLDFYTNGLNRMTVTNGGSVGIGTQRPQTKLEVTNGAISLFNVPDDKLWIWEYDQTNNYAYFDEFGVGRHFVMKNGGNIGIGATNPLNKLHVHKNSADLNFIQITNTATGNATAVDGLRIGIDNTGNSFFWNGENKNIHFVANGEYNMTIAQTSGNVGIGTETPPTKLSVNNGGISILNSADSKRWELNYDQNNDGFYIDEFGINRHFIIKNGGNIGIGTQNPSFPLEINKNVISSQVVSEYDYNVVSNNPGNGAFSAFYSMKASQKILAQTFNAFSDARHKTRIGYYTNSLATICGLKVSKYKFIDTLTKGNEIQVGFLAQEVEKVFPEAVSKIKSEYIPDAYCFAEKIEFDTHKKILKIRLPKNHEYHQDDEIKMIAADGEIFRKISKILDNQTFMIENWDKNLEKLFIFGKKVNDFRTVDYDKIFTLGISAIQELSKEIEDLKKNHEKRISELESKINTILTSSTKQP